MKIALISYEFAGLAASGGIGTYMRNAARMLSERGHHVEVFTSGTEVSSIRNEYGATLHTLPGARETFALDIVPTVSRRQEEVGFDVVEGPEYNCDASGLAAALPSLPLVVKLHGPSFTIFESNRSYVTSLAKARFFAGGILRGRIPSNPWHYDHLSDQERAHALRADSIVANSHATATKAAKAWRLRDTSITSVPYVFYPPAGTSDLVPVRDRKTVLFLGRLEVRKGVIELARAIPLVLREDTSVHFRIVGRALPHPSDRVSVLEHMKNIIGADLSHVQFQDAVPYSSVPDVLGACDICVFPSDWEASGFVCMEAMTAARGVIGSSAGGMAEIIEHGRTGLLVPPRNPRAIADAILQMLADPDRRIAMGLSAREHVLSAYSPDVIGPLQEASYIRAIENASARLKASGH